MRNLHVIMEERLQVKLEGGGDGSSLERLVAAAFDAERGRFFFASDACCVYSINLLSEQDRWVISLLDSAGDAAPAAATEQDQVVSMEFLLEKECLVLAMATGDILQLAPASHEIEVVGTVVGGIKAMALSPDGEMLVFATGIGQLLVMTQDWDLLFEISLDQTEGSSLSGLIHPGGVQISWRGDGKYFATLTSPEEDGKSSFIKVWERETGALHSSGEGIHSPYQALSWSPNGSRIATARSRKDEGKSPGCLFFERNGLKRDSFEILAPTAACVHSLRWNSNSELLALLVKGQEWDAVQLWNCNNYHWYLKQEWRFRPEEQVKFFWDPEKPLCIVLWTLSGYIRRINLCWKTSVVGRETSFVIDGSYVLVTPLFQALVPPPMSVFKISFAAPVLIVAAFFEREEKCFVAACLADNSLSVISLPDISTWNDLMGADFTASPVKSGPGIEFSKLRNLSLLGPGFLVGSLFDSDLKIEQNGRGDGKVMTPAYTATGSTGDNIVQFSLRANEGEPYGSSWTCKLVSETRVDKGVIAMVSNTSDPLARSQKTSLEAYFQMVDGSVALFSTGNESVRGVKRECSVSLSTVKFPAPSPWMSIVSHRTEDGVEDVIVGLAESGLFHVGNKLVNSNCTSFVVHETVQRMSDLKVSHVVFTTRLDTMHIVNLEDILNGVLFEEKIQLTLPRGISGGGGSLKSAGNSASHRKVRGIVSENILKVRPLWERGARIVTTKGGKEGGVILQTVRGNLESVYPRVLVLGAIATELISGNFQDAVLLARRNRINLNVIVDYKGWEEFARDCIHFVKQVRNLSHVTELIGALNKEDVMSSTYKNLVPGCKGYQQVESSGADDDRKDSRHSANKVEGVLAALRSALLQEVPDSPEREMCILTTFARSDPPELEAALKRVKELREAEIRSIREGSMVSTPSKLSAEAAVKHLIWLTDSDSVFSVALGLYDLHLAAIVASHAQKDPKEFLPLLEELGNLPGPKMRYRIDCKLGRWESALRNCADMGEEYFKDCVDLLRENPSLFPTGLQLFKDENQKRKVLDAWGDHLSSEKEYNDAAAAFCASGRLDRALDMYRLGGQWELVMIMAGRLGKTQVETEELATGLRDELEAMGRPKEAAKISLEYLKDLENALRLLVDAHEWSEAARLGYLLGQQEFVDSHLLSAVMECTVSDIRELNEGVEKVGKYLARFSALHQRRLVMSAKLRGQEQGQETGDFDASSDISLASSRASGLTGLSVYTRGPGEEMALVEHLRSLALSHGKLQEQRLLLQALVQLGQEDKARQLQKALCHFMDVHGNAVKETEKRILEDTTHGSEPVASQGLEQSSRTDSKEAESLQWRFEILKEA